MDVDKYEKQADLQRRNALAEEWLDDRPDEELPVCGGKDGCGEDTLIVEKDKKYFGMRFALCTNKVCLKRHNLIDVCKAIAKREGLGPQDFAEEYVPKKSGKGKGPIDVDESSSEDEEREERERPRRETSENKGVKEEIVDEDALWDALERVKKEEGGLHGAGESSKKQKKRVYKLYLEELGKRRRSKR